MIKTETVRCEIKDHVALVTMDRPPVNAIERQLQTDLTVVFDTLSETPDARAAILTGAGKVFCGGADIKARIDMAAQGPGEVWQQSRRAREAFNCILECKIPVIGALNGPALGAGLAIAASCDMLIAAETGCLGLPEINVGLLGGGRHCQRLFSHSRLRRMMLTGHRVFGPELYRLGIVEECVPANKLMERAMALAMDVASKSPVATRLAKHALNTIEFMTLRDGYRFEQNMTRDLTKSEDSKEAMRAFVEKRAPVFTGR